MYTPLPLHLLLLLLHLLLLPLHLLLLQPLHLLLLLLLHLLPLLLLLLLLLRLLLALLRVLSLNLSASSASHLAPQPRLSPRSSVQCKVGHRAPVCMRNCEGLGVVTGHTWGRSGLGTHTSARHAQGHWHWRAAPSLTGGKQRAAASQPTRHDQALKPGVECCRPSAPALVHRVGAAGVGKAGVRTGLHHARDLGARHPVTAQLQAILGECRARVRFSEGKGQGRGR